MKERKNTFLSFPFEIDMTLIITKILEDKGKKNEIVFLPKKLNGCLRRKREVRERGKGGERLGEGKERRKRVREGRKKEEA